MAFHCYCQLFSALIIILSIINVNLIQSASIPDRCLDYCSGGGYCYEIDAVPKCICSPKWTGERCNIPSNGALVDLENGIQTGMTLRSYLCKQLPANFCKNGGICYLDDATKKLACQCPYPYSGDYCEEQEFDECDGFCENGGTCEIENDAPKCTCPEGLTGARCTRQATTTTTTAGTTTTNAICDSLDPKYCNSGTCYPFNGKLCLCPPTHTGDRCETPLGGASSGSSAPTLPTAPTMPGQTTQSSTSPTGPGGLLTTMAQGITCEQQPCQNGARCYPNGNSVFCLCNAGFSGPYCATQG